MQRGCIAVFFILVGVDKFGPAWTALFEQIGFGHWFQNFTGWVEIAGGVLVLIPRTFTAGMVLLGATMASAALIMIVVIHRPLNCIPSTVILTVLIVIWWNRQR